MGLEFINVFTNERRNISDLHAALALASDPGRSWAIKNPAVDSGSVAWEIGLSSAPMKGTYPNKLFDFASFNPDNLNFYNPVLGQMFTLRELVAWANSPPVLELELPPVVDPFEDVVYPVYEPYVAPVVGGPGDALLPPVDTTGLWPGASTVPPPLLDYPVPPPVEPYVLPVDLKPGPPKLPWELVPPVLYPIEPIYTGPDGPWGPPMPFVPPDAGYKPAPMFPAPVWTVTVDPDGGMTETRAFPVRVVVEGKGRLVFSEAELSDALANGGHIAGPDDNGNLTDVVHTDIFLPPKRIDYAEPAAGFPWWLLLVGAGLVLSKRKG